MSHHYTSRFRTPAASHSQAVNAPNEVRFHRNGFMFAHSHSKPGAGIAQVHEIGLVRLYMCLQPGCKYRAKVAGMLRVKQ